jgi:hypothetical protein
VQADAFISFGVHASSTDISKAVAVVINSSSSSQAIGDSQESSQVSSAVPIAHHPSPITNQTSCSSQSVFEKPKVTVAKPPKKRPSPSSASAAAAAPIASSEAPAVASAAHVALARHMMVNRMGPAAAATAAAMMEKAAAAGRGVGGGDAKDTAAARSLNKQAKHKEPKPSSKEDTKTGVRESTAEGQGSRPRDKSTPKFRAM